MFWFFDLGSSFNNFLIKGNIITTLFYIFMFWFFNLCSSFNNFLIKSNEDCLYPHIILLLPGLEHVSTICPASTALQNCWSGRRSPQELSSHTWEETTADQLLQCSPDCLSLSSLHHLQPAPTTLAAAGGCHNHQEAVLFGIYGQASHQAQLAKFGEDF